MSVGEFLKQILPYRKLGAPVPEVAPGILEDLTTFYPDEHDVDMLQSREVDDESTTFLAEVDALCLIQIAGRLGLTVTDAHRRLTRIKALGLRLNYPADKCRDEIVRWQDLLLLTVFLNGQPPCVSGTVSPEHLENVVKETGDSIEWLAGRLQLYAPLFSLDLPPEYVVD